MNRRPTLGAPIMPSANPIAHMPRGPHEVGMFKFLDAAAEYFAGITPDPKKPGRAFRQAYGVLSPASPDRRLAFETCFTLAQRFQGTASPGLRAFFDRLRGICRPEGEMNKDAACVLGVDLVRRHARLLPRARRHDVEEGSVGSELGHYQRTLVLHLLANLSMHVDSKVGKLLAPGKLWNDDGVRLILDLLSRFDAKPKGKRGKLGGAAILAPILQRAGALDHSLKRPEADVRKAIEEAVRRHRKHAP